MSEPSSVIGIDIGGTHVKAVRLSLDGRREAVARRDTVDVVAALMAVVQDLIDEVAPEGADEAALGLAAPGLAAADGRSIAWMRGRLAAVEGLDWIDVLGRPVSVLNDGHAAVLGEAWVGAAAARREVVMLTLGTGVGGGVVVDGRLLRGAIGRAGHLGHVPLELDGSPDLVGIPGSLEDFIGDHNVTARTGFDTTRDLVAAMVQGDEAAATHWHRSVRALACGVAGLINIFDPEAVVIGGGIAEAGGELFEPLRAALDELEWRPLGDAVPVVPATLGDVAGAVGAARFALINQIPKEYER